jgi:hypothetical protein
MIVAGISCVFGQMGVEKMIEAESRSIVKVKGGIGRV